MDVWHQTHNPVPIDIDDDPALMCPDCLVCACCEPDAAAAPCVGEPTGLVET
jgi:hypothetical protein